MRETAIFSRGAYRSSPLAPALLVDADDLDADAGELITAGREMFNAWLELLGPQGWYRYGEYLVEHPASAERRTATIAGGGRLRIWGGTAGPFVSGQRYSLRQAKVLLADGPVRHRRYLVLQQLGYRLSVELHALVALNQIHFPR